MPYLKGRPSDKHTVKHSVLSKMFGNKKPTTTNNTEAKKENLTEQFRFKLSKQTRSKLQLLSKATNLSQAEILRQGIEAFSKATNGKNELVIGGKFYTKAKSLRVKKIG